ncbi:unnamed protein product [Mycena citricolor]|uniref:Uncharacterized protein n=1 Tax=Mycena citricolor TaxID=2018698 RepID=A0AAD2Q4E9_9AGAR|nr:unnamed protein product [Mycena citricolor]
MPPFVHVFQDFPFDSSNVLLSVIRHITDHSRRYGIQTYYSEEYGLPMETTIENRVGTICGVIDWEKKSFRIGSKIEWMDTMRRKAGIFSSAYFWRWLEGEEFRVQYHNSGDYWTTTNAKGEIIAELKLSTLSPLYGDGEAKTLPVLRISQMIWNEDERLFLLLILLYSEARRRVQGCITI